MSDTDEGELSGCESALLLLPHLGSESTIRNTTWAKGRSDSENAFKHLRAIGVVEKAEEIQWSAKVGEILVWLREQYTRTFTGDGVAREG